MADWTRCRAEYEAGWPVHRILAENGVSRSSLYMHKKKEGWQKNAIPAETARAEAQTAGAEINEKHKRSWAGMAGEILDALRAADADRLRCYKTAAEALRIVQEGERRAWGLDRTAAVQGSIEVRWLAETDAEAGE